jgi:hypothetical protein
MVDLIYEKIHEFLTNSKIQNAPDLELVLLRGPIAAFQSLAAAQAVNVRISLGAGGKAIGFPDMLNAGHALAAGQVMEKVPLAAWAKSRFWSSCRLAIENASRGFHFDLK